MGDTPLGVVRSPRTLTLYASLGCLGYLLAGLGAILPELRAERGLPRAEVALYPSAFALGLIVVGVAGHRLARGLGAFALPAALSALVGGAAILAAGGGRLSAGAGALLLGLGGAGLIQLVPAGLQAEHGDSGTVAIGEANAVSSAASVVAPLLVGATLAIGAGWRFGFAGPPLVLAAVLILVLSRRGPGLRAAHVPDDAGSPAPRAFWGWWLDIVLAVSVEFCVLFWSADFLRTEKGLSGGAATAASAGFVLGMAAGRAATGPAVRLPGGPVRLVAGAAALAGAGFAIFWAVPAPPVAIAGLIVTGVGVALLYPVSLGRSLAAWPGRPERAVSFCALASGLAVGAAPLVLGVLADMIGLRAATLLAPLLLVVLLAHCAVRVRPGPR